MDNNQNNRELGLIDVLQIMGQWFVSLVKKMAQWVLFLFFFGLKRWKYLVVVCALAGAYSLLIYLTQKSQYEADMILRSNAMETVQMKTYLDKFSNILNNDLLLEEQITAQTGLDSTQRSQITSMKTYFCIDVDRDGVKDKVDWTGKLESSDVTLDSLNLCVKVRFNDVSILDVLSNNIQLYIESVPYVVTMNEARLSKKIKRRDFIMNEIDLLDTLQQLTYVKSELSPTLHAQGGNVVVDNRKVIVYRDKVALWDLYEAIANEIEVFSAPVTIVEDFVIQKAAVNSFSTIVRKNVLYAFALTYFILILGFIYNKEKGNYLK